MAENLAHTLVEAFSGLTSLKFGKELNFLNRKKIELFKQEKIKILILTIIKI